MTPDPKPTPGDAPGFLPRLVLTALPVAVVWTFCWFGVFTFVNAYVAQVLRADTVTWTRLTLLFIAGVVFWQACATEISSRIGRRHTITLTMVVAGLGFGAIGLARRPLTVALVLPFVSMMHAVYFVVWMPMVAAAARQLPGRALAATQMVYMGTSLLGLLVGGPIVGSGRFGTLFAAGALASLACAVVFSRLSRAVDARTGHLPVVGLRRLRGKDIAALMRSEFAWIMLAGLLLEPFGFHTENQLFPNLAREIHGWSEGAIGVAVALVRIPALLALVLLTRYVDRLQPTRCYGFGLAVAGAAVMLTGLAPSPLWAAAGYALFYVGQGTVWGSNGPAVNAVVPPHLKDAAFSFMGISLTLMIFAAGVTHNRMLESGLSLRTVFVACGAVCALGGAILLTRFAGGRDRKDAGPVPDAPVQAP